MVVYYHEAVCYAEKLVQYFQCLRHSEGLDNQNMTLISSHLSLNCKGCWGTTDDFATSILHYSLFSTALWDLANSRPVLFLMLSSNLFFCLPCLFPPFHCALQDGFGQTWWTGDMTIPLLRLFTMVRMSCGPITRWILARTSCIFVCMRCIASCGSISFPWLVFFFGALLWGSMIHKHVCKRLATTSSTGHSRCAD